MPAQVVVVPGRLPEGRVDPLYGYVVVISAARALRESKKDSESTHPAILPEYDERCSFCPGNNKVTNEDKTPPELVSFRRDPFDITSWSTRGFTNLFPILALEAEGPAQGVNEIIVETRRHNGFLSSISIEELSEAFRAITIRYFSLRNDPRLEWFSAFKNYGKLAGASMEHPHFQMAVEACIPPKFRERLNRAQDYFYDSRRYLCCDYIEKQRKLGQVIFETEHFVVLVPYAARVPYHFRIFPIKHNPSFAHVLRDSDCVRTDFAETLRRITFLFKIAVQGKDFQQYADPLYNFYIETAPYRDDHKEGILHWHVEFRGKTTIEAGYEYHTGKFVNPTYPEEIAAQLKEIAAKFKN